ncbi:MAG: FecR domain-containing protein [candidate division KSB1 bacterium]|nr:FecR domain-containing protein [candidate division KSB1 bacterium]MDZ7335911.1 FecR domain-containing protein [candidate division KSB1 bacterium]MDZ7356024.1 FecR domain-containing protein [candidate division KSB1 bacterium]MDZ7376619.1 FecR domain-containing protein [candidate division KSB1 bacterium]MDZ7400642.1 FecR domain-containing protein [candidate division KSB1 bacterium]
MNKQLVFWGGLLLVVILIVYGFLPAGKSSIGSVNFILGDAEDVMILRAGHDTWEPAKLYQPIFAGDQIKTNQESRCETKLVSRGVVRIGENSIFEFSEDLLKKKLNANLKTGSIWANIRLTGRDSNFWIRTPNAVCSVRGTIYRIDADSSTQVKVYQGQVDVGPLWLVKRDSSGTRQSGIFQAPTPVPGPSQVPGPFEVSLDHWIQIVAGQQIEVRANGKYYKSNFDLQQDQDNDWVRWNQQRDQMK